MIWSKTYCLHRVTILPTRSQNLIWVTNVDFINCLHKLNVSLLQNKGYNALKSICTILAKRLMYILVILKNKIGVGEIFFLILARRLLCSARLHLFDQKYNTNSNILK